MEDKQKAPQPEEVTEKTYIPAVRMEKQIYSFLTRDQKSEIYEDASALVAFTATMNATVDIRVYLSRFLKGPEAVHEISKPSLRFHFFEPIAVLRMNFVFSGRLCVVIYVVNHFTTPPSNKYFIAEERVYLERFTPKLYHQALFTITRLGSHKFKIVFSASFGFVVSGMRASLSISFGKGPEKPRSKKDEGKSQFERVYYSALPYWKDFSNTANGRNRL